MKTKSKRIFFSISLIMMLVSGMVLAPMSQANADQSTDTKQGSGGFIIETAKVDGAMDLVGALTGNITIWEGEIYGLTITKVVDRGSGKEPLVIRIKAPGPIPVKNLNAKTVNHELPNIGGLCKPGKVGWVCMENVVMNVEEQVVEDISLVGATVETCYVSQCGALPEYNPMVSLEELEKILNGDQQEENVLEKIIDQIADQEKQLDHVKEIIKTITDTLKDLESQDYPSKLLDQIAEIENGITQKVGLDQLLAPVKEVKTAYQAIQEQISLISPLLDEVGKRMNGVDAKIPEIEEALAQYEAQFKDSIKAEKQLAVYEQLAQLAKMQENGEKIDISKVEDLMSDTTKEDQLKQVHERLDQLKQALQEQKDNYQSLHKQFEMVQSENEKVSKEMDTLSTLLQKLKGNEGDSDDGLVDEVLDPVEDNILDPVKDKVLDPVKDKVLDPVKDKVLDPVTDEVLDPIKDNVVDPVKEEVLDPILDPITGELIDPVTGKVIDYVIDPITGEILDPITGKVVDPLLDTVGDKVLNPLLDPVKVNVLDPVLGTVEEKTLDSLLNPFKKKGK